MYRMNDDYDMKKPLYTPAVRLGRRSLISIQAFVSNSCHFLKSKMKLFIGVCLVLAVAAAAADKMRFDHFKVFNVKVVNSEQIKVLRHLEETAAEGEYVFGNSLAIGRDVDVVVPPHRLYEFNGILNKFNIVNELKVENLQT